MSQSNYTSAVITVTTSETEITAANNSRTALVLYNQGPSPVDVYFAENSTMFVTIPAGDGLQFTEIPRNQIQGVVSSGTAAVTVWEA